MYIIPQISNSHRGAWNLPHKFHLYLIENGHKKISPTRIRSGSGVTLSLCHSVTLSLCNSVTLCATNGLITSPPFIRLGRNFFCLHLGKKVCLKIFFSRPRAGWAGARGQKNSDLSSYLSHMTRYRSEIWNLGPKLQNKIKIFYKKKFGRWPWADGRNWLCPFWPVSTFFIKMTQTYFAF